MTLPVCEEVRSHWKVHRHSQTEKRGGAMSEAGLDHCCNRAGGGAFTKGGVSYAQSTRTCQI